MELKEVLRLGGKRGKSDGEGGVLTLKLNEFLHQREIMKELRRVCGRGEKSLVVHFDSILEFNMELAKSLLDGPIKFLGEATRELEQIVKWPGMCLRVRGLDKTLEARDVRAVHVDKFVQVSGAVTHVFNPRLVRIGDEADMEEFEDYQEIRLDDFLVVVLRRDLVGKAKLEDRITLTGFLKAVKDGGFYDFVLEANHLEGHASGPRGSSRREFAKDPDGLGA